MREAKGSEIYAQRRYVLESRSIDAEGERGC